MLALVLTLLIGCKPPVSYSGGYTLRALAGTWHDETNTQTTITRTGAVTSIIDTDSGEVYEVLAVDASGERFHWRYAVPSTQYTVDIWVDGVAADTALIYWSNSAGASGSEQMERVTD